MGHLGACELQVICLTMLKELLSMPKHAQLQPEGGQLLPVLLIGRDNIEKTDELGEAGVIALVLEFYQSKVHPVELLFEDQLACSHDLCQISHASFHVVKLTLKFGDGVY